MITKLWAKNFRSLEDLELELAPLSVLVGPNASGKSNIVDVLRFIAEAMRNGLEAAVNARQGIGAVRRWSAHGRPYDVEIGLQGKTPEFTVEYGFVLTGKSRREYRVKREYGKVEPKGIQEKPFEFEVKEGVLEATPREAPSQQPLFEADTEPPHFEPTNLALPLIRRIYRMPRTTLRRRARGWQPPVYPLSQLYSNLTNMRFYHIFPNIFREPQKPGTLYPLGEHGENLASVLREMLKRPSLLLPDLREALGKVVPGVCEVSVAPVSGYLVVKLKHSRGGRGNGEGAWFDLSQESDGTLRLLGLLVALFQDPPPTLIAIEEPELTIHPGALAVLTDLLQEATRRTQILITTHSPELIDRLPVEALRAVESVAGVTNAGMVADHQREAVRQGLFSPGELHRMEGIQRASIRD